MKPVRPLPTLKHAFQRALVSDNGIRDGAIIFAFKAGETVERLCETHNLTSAEVQAILRAYMKR